MGMLVRYLLPLGLAMGALAADYPATNADFPNPERGFYEQTAYDPGRGTTKPLDAGLE